MTNFPFGDDFMPQFLNDIMGMMSSSNDSYLQIAQQLAFSIVSKGSRQATADPKLRLSMEPLVDLVTMRIETLLEEQNWTNLLSVKPQFEFVSPEIWIEKSFKELSDLLSEIAESFLMKESDNTELNQVESDTESNPQDQFKNLLANVFQMTAPASLGMQIGSIFGHYALNSFGSYDLNIPRNTNTIMVIADNIDSFATEWSVDLNDATIWTLTRQIIAHLILRQSSIRTTFITLISRHALGLRVGTEKLSDQLKNFDFTDLSTIENMFNNQESVFEIEPSLIHEQTTKELAVLIALTEALIENISELIDVNTVGKSNVIKEAVLRYKTQFNNLIPLTETLFGYYFDEELFGNGNEFVQTLLQDSNENWIQILLKSEDNLPNETELCSPEAWKLRVKSEN